VGALGHYLEDEGVATTQISLVREHTAALNPPRALWVPFILGRPFGAPGDAAFQRRVAAAALRLLEAERGPVLEDFGEAAPEAPGAEGDAFACPVSFGCASPDGEDAALEREIAALRPWSDLARRRRGHGSAALSGLTAEQAGRFVEDFIANPALPSYRADFPTGLALRLACEDLKAHYLEAVSAQPGALAAAQAHAWFWRETAAGRTLRKLRAACLASRDPTVQAFGSNNLVPRAILHTPDQ
jgi:hypothetical protein